MAVFPTAQTDARGHTVTLSEAPSRIVSLVPSQTELLSYLGLDRHVVGVTRFCEHPDHWRSDKTVVGGTKQVDVDAVRSLEPDFVLANLEENEREDVEALDAIAPVYVTEVKTVPEALDIIRTVGTLVGRDAFARQLAAGIAERFDELPAFAALRAVYLIWRDPYMSVGGDTFIHDVMRRAGLDNVYGDRTRYPEVTVGEIADEDPDVVLCSSEPFPFHQKDRFTADLREALSPERVRVVNGQAFSWYGSRLLETPAYLKSLRRELEVGRPA
jgi:ABC-type Fe3+-hydroxamate transport system substrate-binding protein